MNGELWLQHPKEISVGLARVVYIQEGGRIGYWALPGGRATTDEREAFAVATRMAEILARQERREWTTEVWRRR